VLLVGGSTRVPLVATLLEERLRQPAHQEVQPELCVALGAGVQAAMIAGMEVGPVLVDITPHSLGIRCLGEVHGLPSDTMFSRIIARNSPLPALHSEVYQTVFDAQEAVQIEVYQGEHEDVRRNTFVGEFSIEGLAPVPAGNEVVVHMHLTLDGILQVTATEKRTSLQQQVRIENALARFQREDREAARQRLASLFDAEALALLEDEEDDEEDTTEASVSTLPMPEAPEDITWQRTVVQVRALLEKAERLLVGLADEDRQEIERSMALLRGAVAGHRLAEVAAQSAALADALFYLEDV